MHSIWSLVRHSGITNFNLKSRGGKSSKKVKKTSNQKPKAVGHSFQKIYDITWSLDAVMVHRCLHSGNLKVFPTDQLTNLLTGVGA